MYRRGQGHSRVKYTGGGLSNTDVHETGELLLLLVLLFVVVVVGFLGTMLDTLLPYSHYVQHSSVLLQIIERDSATAASAGLVLCV